MLSWWCPWRLLLLLSVCVYVCVFVPFAFEIICQWRLYSYLYCRLTWTNIIVTGDLYCLVFHAAITQDIIKLNVSHLNPVWISRNSYFWCERRKVIMFFKENILFPSLSIKTHAAKEPIKKYLFSTDVKFRSVKSNYYKDIRQEISLFCEKSPDWSIKSRHCGASLRFLK